MKTETKELIAIGASVAAHGQPCLKYHYAKARELGIPEEEIEEAIATGQQVESGARKAIVDLEKQLHAAATNSEEESCCGGDSSGGSSCC